MGVGEGEGHKRRRRRRHRRHHRNAHPPLRFENSREARIYYCYVSSWVMLVTMVITALPLIVVSAISLGTRSFVLIIGCVFIVLAGPCLMYVILKHRQVADIYRRAKQAAMAAQAQSEEGHQTVGQPTEGPSPPPSYQTVVAGSNLAVNTNYQGTPQELHPPYIPSRPSTQNAQQYGQFSYGFTTLVGGDAKTEFTQDPNYATTYGIQHENATTSVKNESAENNKGSAFTYS